MFNRGSALEVRVPLLEWLPGETFYSLCSRHHRFSGHVFSADTTQAFFGHRRSGCQHDLPSRLDAFVERTDGVYGDAARIARERTALRFYAPFLSPGVIQDAVASMRSPSVAHLKYRLGILTSRFGANHPLKACPSCLSESVRTQGWSAWLVEHQYPGVWMCLRHRRPLLIFELKANGVERFSWQLPSLGQLRPALKDETDAVSTAMLGLAQLTQQLIEVGERDGRFQPVDLQEAIRRQLANQGLVTAGGNVRVKEIAGDYAAHCQRLRAAPELAALPGTAEEAAAELGRLVRPLRSGTHPIRLLALCLWLFGDAAALRREMVATGRGGEPGDESSEAPFLGDAPRRREFLGLLNAGASVRRASDAVGITANTGIAWAAAAGVTVAARPKVLTADARAQLVKLLRRGCERTDAAKEIGVSVATVDRLFQKEPRLHAAWRDARYAKAQHHARTAWLRATKAGGIKLARSLEPAAYAWLYRNDRPWLDASCSALGRQTATPRNASVKWDVRDAELAGQVRQALTKLVNGRAEPLRLWQVYQAVPELKAKLSSLSRLPITRQVLEQALAGKRKAVNPNQTSLEVTNLRSTTCM